MNTDPIRDKEAMISGMRPNLLPGTFVFVSSDDPDLIAAAQATFREAEGMSLVLPVGIAKAAGLQTEPRMRQITLEVHSSLEGVGLTAAVSSRLAAKNIPCNMIAGLRHDHVFVPETMADEALSELRDLSSGPR